MDTPFGRAALIKFGLLACLVGIEAFHRRRSLPSLREVASRAEAPARAGRTVRRALLAEIALFAVVLGVTRALVGYQPPVATGAGPFSADVQTGPLTVALTVDPARVGLNTAHVYINEVSDGSPFDVVDELSIRISLPSKAIAPIELRSRAAGPGHFVIDTAQLAPAGDWRMEIGVRVSDFDVYETSIQVPIK